MSRFLTDLDARLIDPSANEGRGEWQLDAPLVYLSDLAGTLTVPAGFKTDFASVPRVPIAFLLCGDTASRAAALHDWLYTKPHQLDRATADRVLQEAAIADGVPKWRAWMLWAGVRIGGASHWD